MTYFIFKKSICLFTLSLLYVACTCTYLLQATKHKSNPNPVLTLWQVHVVN